MATKKPAKAAPKSGGFSADERAAMRERARELKAAQRGEDGDKAIAAAINKAPAAERELCMRLHQLIRATVPGLTPKTWYGMPAYADAEEKIVCFFKPAFKFKERYLTLGFNQAAALDDGNLWPTSFAVLKLGATEEKQVRALLRKAVG